MINGIVNHLDDTLLALADPTRRAVVDLLRAGPRRASEIADHVAMSRQATSRHLNHLRERGIVAVDLVDEDGRGRLYRLRPERLVRARCVARPGAGRARRAAGRLRPPRRPPHHPRDGRVVSDADVDAVEGAVRAAVEVPLAAAEAFRVFTAEIGSWYVVDRHTVVDHRRTVDIRIEPRVGGRFLDVHDAAKGAGVEMGRVTLWDPPRRLAFVDDRQTETEVTFSAADEGRTLVAIEQRGLDRLPPAEAEHVRRFGWRLLLGWFADSLASTSRPKRRNVR